MSESGPTGIQRSLRTAYAKLAGEANVDKLYLAATLLLDRPVACPVMFPEYAKEGRSSSV